MVLERNDGLYLVDVGGWTAVRLGARAHPQDEPHTEQFRGWSSQGRSFAAVDFGKRNVGGWNPAVLQEWDPRTLSFRAVGCMIGSNAHYPWEKADLTWSGDTLVVTDEGKPLSNCQPPERARNAR